MIALASSITPELLHTAQWFLTPSFLLGRKKKLLNLTFSTRLRHLGVLSVFGCSFLCSKFDIEIRFFNQ